ncbi:MAG: OmpA family protein [Proteobacteria bacterium]|nr:OmpA family protein [Pseudomonadota bacterium]
MSVKTWARSSLAIALLAASGAVFAQSAQQSNEPTVDSIVNALKSNNNQGSDEATRALRPGAASMATTAPMSAPDASPAPAPAAAASAAPKPKPSVTRPHRARVARSADRASTDMTINFEFNSDQIAGDSQQTMATLATALASPQLADRRFTVVGHTDAKGSASYNQALSDRRAEAVRAYLVAHGIAADRLTAEGKGESELVNPRNPDSAQNRRVEIIATGR